MLSIGEISIDVPAHQVMRDGAQVSLTPLEFDFSSGWRWPASRARCSPARCCSSRSGATGTRQTPGWSTCTCSG